MSTENEGTAAPKPPAAPSAPPVPVAAPTPEPVAVPAAPVDARRADAPEAGARESAAPAVEMGKAPGGADHGYVAASAPAEHVTRQLPTTSAPGAEAAQQVPPTPAAPYGAPPATTGYESPGAAPYGAPDEGAPALSYGAPAGPPPGHGAHGAPGAEAWPPPPPAVPAYGAQGHEGGNGGGVWGAPLAADAPQPKPKGRGGLIVAVLAAALLAGGVGGGIGYKLADGGFDGSGSTTVSSGETPKDLKRESGSVAGLAAKALPSVVTIEAQGGDGEGGTGTGFVYDQQGHILTNNHVVASAASGGKLSATFSNGKKYDAEVVGRAQGYDVAVLKLKNPPAGLNPLALGDSDKVAVGDTTIAIGAPFGLSNTVTTGIVSAKNRPVASGDGASNKNSYMSALQTDASINPGNSGGPLLDGRGAVIGINSAIQSAGNGGFGGGQAGSIGLGFAIPVNQAKNVAEQLIKTGKPTYPVIGVSVDLQSKTDGAKISEQGAAANELVDPAGPAGKAGLKPGDVITQFGDKPVDSGPTLISEIWTYKPGDTVKLTYLRGGKPTTVDITLGSRVGDK
ncbi:trypsin-like peptidase domain-containing protein [Streptomyces sp. G-G2]|uniref:S1C family serine protease n=1 Tax=Streptomyces sp. G-G2 TaxID=3046201 RepID=UPI0024BB8257|nr:trypsin-like peptidase domain-containing protein [Streptomyces sp. G-G2]MDJ0383995.1 trypsin-like peptidase domain-containing protein [Streptomyces sp. G-G2]